MPVKHLLWSSDLNKEDYNNIFQIAEKFVKEGIPSDLMPGKIVATLFFQPSTRTMSSFQSAMLRAGGGWIGVTGKEALSMEKDEDLEDTIRTYGSYADVIVLRHPDDDSANIAGRVSEVPVVNGGSGSKEHAVAAALLLFDIYHHLGKLEGLKVGLYGTPEINRCCKAMIPIMGHYGIKLMVDDLGNFPVPKEIEERAKKNGLAELKYDQLDSFLPEVDVLVVTRGLQKGIIPEDKFPKEKAEMILKSYKPITTEHMKKLRKDAYLIMITPRIFEIEKDVDPDPRAIYSKKGTHTEVALAVVAHLMAIKV